MIGRRHFMAAGAAAFLTVVWLLPLRGAVASPDGAQAFIKSLSKNAITVLQDDSLDDEGRIAKLGQLFQDGFDTRTISRFVLGRYWRSASKEQLREYTRLFNEFVIRTYASRLKDYAGETLEVKDTREAAGDFIVASEIVRPEGPPTRVDWRVRSYNDNYKVIDVMVEGVSMAITQRDEFGAVLSQNGGQFEGLLVALRERAAQH